jgi:pimeloyl-ACP methyl ester carboxylesterase
MNRAAPLLLLGLAACHAAPDSDTDTDTVVDDPVAWQACPLYVDQPDGPQAECATIDVPLRWSDPDGPTIGIFVQRLRGTGDVRGQLWLLEGGPGGSGADFDSAMADLATLDPGLDLYAVDHRGVGRSARLSCPEQEAEGSEWGLSLSPGELDACSAALQAEWGDDLAEFTTTAAAHDLSRLIDVAAEPGEDVFVYGVSYGTYWAHRYLQVAPDQATAVVLDSIAPPGEDFAHYDADFDAVAQDYLELCAADELCASKLGPDPWDAVGTLLAELDAGGHCTQVTRPWGIDGPTARVVMASLLVGTQTRPYLPAFVYRLHRCDAGDVTALDHMLDVFFGSATTTYYDTLDSDALFYEVSRSELWPSGASVDEVDAVEAGLRVTTGLSPSVAAGASWPTYPPDAYMGEWAETDTPLLMLNGDLDPQTPIWVGGEAADHLTGPHQYFYTVPRSAHCTIYATPYEPGADRTCSMQIMLAFLQDPTVPPDTACLDAIPLETFTGVPATNAYVLGTSDLWENGP